MLPAPKWAVFNDKDVKHRIYVRCTIADCLQTTLARWQVTKSEV